MATSLTEHFCRSRAFTIIASHFQQLTSIGYVYRNVVNYHFDVSYSSEEENQTVNIGYPYVLRLGVCRNVHYGKKKKTKTIEMKRISFFVSRSRSGVTNRRFTNGRRIGQMHSEILHSEKRSSRDEHFRVEQTCFSLGFHRSKIVGSEFIG